MSEVSEGASEGSFRDLSKISEFRNPLLKICSSTTMEISANTIEKMSGNHSPATNRPTTKEPDKCVGNHEGLISDSHLPSRCLQMSHGLEYNNEWSKEVKQLNHLLTVGKPVQRSTQSTDPSTIDQPTASIYSQLQSYNSPSTNSSNTLPVSTVFNSSLQNQLPARVRNSPRCPFRNSCNVFPESSPPICRKALADRFNQSSNFVELCDVSDKYSMVYSPLADEVQRNNQASSYSGSNLYFQENMGYGQNGDGNPAMNSIAQDHGYQTEPSTQEEMYSSDYPYYEDEEEEEPSYNCMDSSIRSINYCQTGASGEDLYDPSVIVDQLEASVRQQVDLQVKAFQNNLHQVIYEQVHHFRELVTVQTTDIPQTVPLKTSQRIHSIDSNSSQRHCHDDDNSDCQPLSSTRADEEQLEDNQSHLLIQLLTHSNRLCTALTREQYT